MIKYWLSTIFSLVLAITLISCSNNDSLYVEDSSINHLKVQTSIIRNIGSSPYPVSNFGKDTVNLGEEIQFIATLLLDGEKIEDFTNTGIQSQRWILNNDTIFSNSIKCICSQQGWQYAIFEMIDYFGDMYRDSIAILVNSPLSIDSIISPNTIYQNAPLSPNSIDFEWILGGLDSNEIIENYLYLSPYIDSLYYYPVAKTISNTKHNKISIPINLSKWYDPDSIDLSKSYTLYWTITSKVIGSTIRTGYLDSTSIYKLNTKLSPETPSRIVGEVNYKQNIFHDSIEVKLFAGNELINTLFTPRDGKFVFDSLKEGNYTLSFNSSEKAEYIANDIEINLETQTEFNIDSMIYMYDYFPPQAVLLTSDTLYEYNRNISDDFIAKIRLSDYGSGVDTSTVKLFVNEKEIENISTIDNVYEIDLNNTYTNDINIRASFADYSSNKSNNIIWNLTIDKDTVVGGL